METVPLLPALTLLRFDVGQAYLYDDGTALTLIDTGLPGNTEAIAAAVDARGALARIVLTHGHVDHIGCAAELAARYGVPILAHPLDGPVIRGERPRAEPVLTADWERELWATMSAMDLPAPPPTPVHREIVDGDALDVAGGATVVGLPGHTPGSIGVYLAGPRVLCTGDAIAAGPDGPIVGVFNTDPELARRSMDKASRLDVAIACFGHGEPGPFPRPA